jgi:hypothetical protein
VVGANMTTTAADAFWKVSATEKTVSGRTWRHGFGFSIQDFRGLSILSISYESERAAKEAESAIRKALQGAMDITKG